MLELKIFTSFWGRVLKGRTNRNDTVPPMWNTNGFIVDVEIEGIPFRTKNIRMLRPFSVYEAHFFDAGAQQWDLYYLGENIRKNERQYSDIPDVTSHFALLPHPQAISFANCHERHGWKFLGTCETSILRMELRYYLTPILKGVAERFYRSQLQEFRCLVEVLGVNAMVDYDYHSYQGLRNKQSHDLLESTDAFH
jgi:hypothetical protein